MIEAEFVLRRLEASLDRPPRPSDAGKLRETGVGWSKHDIVGALARVAQTAPYQKPVVKALAGLLEPE